MIDYVGRSQGPSDRARVIGGYMGEADERRRQRWNHRELRDERERDHQWNRTAALDESAFLEQNAGLYTDYGQELAGLGQTQGLDEQNFINRQAAGQASAAETMNPTSPGAGAGAGAGVPRTPAELQRPSGARQVVDINTLRAQMANPGADQQTVREAQAFARFQRIQRRFNRAQVSPAEFAAAQRQLTRDTYIPGRGGLQFDPVSGELYRFNPDQNPLSTPQEMSQVFGAPAAPGAPSATAEIPYVPGPGGAPAQPGSIEQQILQNAGEVPEVDYGPQGPEDAPISGGMPPADAPSVSENYMGVNNVRRGMRPTREMALLHSEVERNLRSARLAARHGRREESATAYAAALVGQAQYLGLLRTTEYNAFRGGNFAAGADLLAQYYGYEPGSLQFARAPGEPDRFVLQTRDAEGNWVTSSEQSFTFQSAVQSIMNLTDAETAAANSEAAREQMTAQIRAGADITVANINARSRLRDNITEIMIANLNNDARSQWEQGQGRLHENSETGQVWFEYQTYNRQTRQYDRQFVEMTRQNVRVADVDGNREEQRTVPQRVTGLPGFGSN